jgi:hypothetical protein
VHRAGTGISWKQRTAATMEKSPATAAAAPRTEVAAGRLQHHHAAVDPDYEFDAPRWFDLAREESPAEAAAAQLWFPAASFSLDRLMEEEGPSSPPRSSSGFWRRLNHRPDDEADNDSACLALPRWPGWVRVLWTPSASRSRVRNQVDRLLGLIVMSH